MRAGLIERSGQYGERIESITGADGIPIRIGDRVELKTVSSGEAWAPCGTVIGFRPTVEDQVIVQNRKTTCAGPARWLRKVAP